MRIEVYSDVICPWCYIGTRRLARAVAEHPDGHSVEMVFRPYQLDPHAPESPVPIHEYLSRRYGNAATGMLRRVSEIAREEDLDVRFDRAVAVNTFAAHRLMWLAEREFGAESQRKLAERIFEGHFIKGANVADQRFLVDAAASAGMTRYRVSQFLESGEGVLEVHRQLDRARAIGIQAVPTFIFDDRFLLEGAHQAFEFRRTLDQVFEQQRRLSAG